MFTDLKKYRLWYDGKKSYNYNQLCAAYFQTDDVIHHPVFITETNDKFEHFFKQIYHTYPIKDTCDDIECDLFPSIDTSFNLREYILECFINKNINESCDDSLKSKFERIEYELSCFDKLKKQDLLYIVIHITNYLNTNKIVWSARGSSSASYVLYVLGIHHIDSFLYDLDPTEFFKIV
ncbi:MAG: hypothetical protein KDH96_03415 [Candidatus Riesia sp.]|nr:hypothetical protein [Candidatus Riesia sp.]